MGWKVQKTKNGPSQPNRQSGKARRTHRNLWTLWTLRTLHAHPQLPHLPTANLVLLPAAAASRLVTTYSTGHPSCHDPPPRRLPTPFSPNAATLPRHYPSTGEDP